MSSYSSLDGGFSRASSTGRIPASKEMWDGGVLNWDAGWELAEREMGLRRPAEIVALGFFDIASVEESRWLGEPLVWEQLENTASDPLSAFHVDGAAVQHLLSRMGRWPVVIWHSHYFTSTPSEVDVQHFPTWLCGVGVVACIPNLTMSLYNEDGIISTLGSPLTTSLTTEG